MTKKENHYLFYSYFLLFLTATYFGRDILSPTKYNFILLYQIPTFLILPILYKQTLATSRFLAGTIFFLFFVLMWEIANFTPLLGLAFSTVVYYYFKINLGFDWAFYILKPVIIMALLWWNRSSLLLSFNSLTATKEYLIDNLSINNAEVENLKLDKVNYIPKNANFYFNPLTQILTILIKNNSNSIFNRIISIANKEHQYFFLNKNKKINPPITDITIQNNLLIIRLEKQNIILNYDCFPASLKKIITTIISTEEDNI